MMFALVFFVSAAHAQLETVHDCVETEYSKTKNAPQECRQYNAYKEDSVYYFNSAKEISKQKPVNKNAVKYYDEKAKESLKLAGKLLEKCRAKKGYPVPTRVTIYNDCVAIQIEKQKKLTDDPCEQAKVYISIAKGASQDAMDLRQEKTAAREGAAQSASKRAKEYFVKTKVAQDLCEQKKRLLNPTKARAEEIYVEKTNSNSAQ